MKKRIISALSAAALVLGSVVFTGVATEARLSPRATVAIENGLMRGIVDVPSADFIATQFTGDVTVASPDGTTLEGEALIPADSVVASAGAEIARVVVSGDANRDAKITLDDVTSMLQSIAGWDVVISDASADINGDSGLTLDDVIALLQYIAGWDVSISTPVFEQFAENGVSAYRLLAGNEAFDSAFVQMLKDKTGVEITVADEILSGEKYIVIGEAFGDDYSFINMSAAADVDDDKSYVDIYDGNIHIVTKTAEGAEYTADIFADMYDGNGSILLPKGYVGPVTHMTESGRLYWGVYDNIKNTAPVVNGTNGMNEDLYIAISNEKFVEPKNIIYMIGDGMGKNIATGTQILRGDDLYGGKLTLSYLPVEGRQSTYSASNQVTDSAAGGTALATGYKTSNGTIAMNSDDTIAYKTLLELAAEKGKSTGVVATKAVTDATPAAFTAHVDDRSEQVDIAGQQLSKLIDGTLDLILGGGWAYYDDGANAGARAAAKERGVTYVKTWDEAYGADLPLAGLFAEEALYTEDDNVPVHIAAMTELAIDLLSEDEDGFFLMVEGSKIDSYGHAKNFKQESHEMFAFDCAVAVALRYVALNPDTVLVITADHETGELSIGEGATAETITGKARYARNDHHWVDVPVYAIGYGTEALAGNQENTDVARFIAGIMGDDSFGQTSEVHTLIDMTDSDTANAIINGLEKGKDAVKITDDGLRVDFGNGITHLFIPSELFEVEGDPLGTVGAVRVTYTNKENKPKLLPQFAFRDQELKSTAIRERITYIAPGATYTQTYVIPEVYKYASALTTSKDIVLFTQAGGDIDLVISDISISSRPLDK